MPPEEKGLKLNTVECQICGKQLSDRRNLSRHMRNVHQIEPKVREPKLKCCYDDNCQFITSTQRLLREHLSSEHNFVVMRKEFSFDNKSDFEAWKHDEEVNTFASYVTDTGVKYRTDKKVFYFRCHRSGHIRCDKKIRVSDRKRSKPTRGYTQEGIICPSSMQVTENQDGKIKVIYFSTHLGHSQDAESVKYMKLSTREKEEIAAKLVHGEPIEKIIADARKKKGKNISRLNLLLKRDVYNIKSTVNYLEKEADHDGLIIDSWVKNMDSGDPMKNPVIFYNPLDDNHNYFLVLIHSIQKIIFSLIHDGSMIYVKTKRGKPNIDFNLIALHILTENGEGYPIAFCISNKTDYLTVYNFFKLVSNALGCMKAQIFISDNITHYYTAWKNVVGDCDKKLLCTFDVDLLWEQKLGQLKIPIEKIELVTNQLKKLLNELDSDVFENELIETLNTWDEDNDLKPFVKYFYKSYGKKLCEWASCYRVHYTREENINHFLEPFHNILETIYQKGINEVYYSLNLLFDFVRNECLFDIMRWDPDIRKEKSKEVQTCHLEYGKIVRQVECKGAEWIVTDSKSDYAVTKIINDCGKECGLLCHPCGICIHDFNCTCNDFVIGFNICVHVHAVVNLSVSTYEGNVGDTSKSVAISAAKNLVDQLKQSDFNDGIYCKISSDVNMVMEKYFGAVDSENRMGIWNQNLELLSELEAPGAILSLAAVDDTLYTCANDGSINIWDLNSLKSSGIATTTLVQPQKLFINKESKILWAGDSQGNVAKFENGQETGKFEMVEEIWDMMVGSNPPAIYTARDRDIVVAELISGSKGTRVMVKCTLEGRSPFCVSGNKLCFLDRDGRIINIHENNIEKKFPKIKDVNASDLIVNAVAAGSENVLFSGGYDSTVKKWDLNTFQCAGSINLNNCINAIASNSPDSAFIARSDGVITKVGA